VAGVLHSGQLTIQDIKQSLWTSFQLLFKT
jgi:hypothetical protein